jgi:hypothetical protein
MENLLNLVWVVVSVGLFIAIRPKKRHVQIALVCAIALLFPIISASDDMSADRDTVRDAAAITPLALVIISLVALALLEEPKVTWRRILIPVKSDPRSPPRR